MTDLAVWLNGLIEGGLRFMTKVPAVVGIFVVGLSLIKVLRGGLQKMMVLRRSDQTLITMVHGVVGFFGWVLILAGVANVLGLNELALALGGSIAIIGLGLASGLSGTVADLIAGIFLLADPDFRVGRQVKSGSIEGAVRTLDVRKTKILDADGNLHIVPNRTLDSGPVMVYPERAANSSLSEGERK